MKHARARHGWPVALALALVFAPGAATPARAFEVPAYVTRPDLSQPELQVVLGTSIAQFAGGHFPSGGPRDGVTVGAAVRLPMSNRWSFRSGAAYVERGTVLGSETYYSLADQPDGTDKLTYELAYAEIPAQFGWEVPVRGAQVTFFAGPALAFKLSEWVHQTGTQEVKVRHDDMIGGDALGEMGVAIETLYAGHRVLAEAIYDEGLVNVLRPIAGGDSVRNTGLRVQLGTAWAQAR